MSWGGVDRGNMLYEKSKPEGRRAVVVLAQFSIGNEVHGDEDVGVDLRAGL